MLLVSYWRWAIKELNRTSPSAYLDTELLFAHVLGLTRAQLHSQLPDRLLTLSQQKRIKQLIARRQSGEPIAYLLGRQEFWSLSFEVTPEVLIPRPETELLVQKILDDFSTEQRNIVDLGTGSAAIAVALALARPTWQFIATDYSPGALQIAERNIRRYHIQTIELRQGDWCQALLVGEKFDIIFLTGAFFTTFLGVLIFLATAFLGAILVFMAVFLTGFALTTVLDVFLTTFLDTVFLFFGEVFVFFDITNWFFA